MAIRMPPLPALRAFAALVEHTSIQSAAEALNLTHGAVGHQIRALERHLGVQLVARQGRRLSLTDAGRIYGYQVRQALRDIGEATQRVQGPERKKPEGALHVAVLPSFLQGWLLPRLAGFCKRHPKIRLHWHASMSYVQLDDERVDCAIRFGHGNWPEVTAQRLMQDRLILVAAPSLLGHTCAASLKQLLKWPLLHASESWSGYWATLPEELRALQVPPPRMVFDDSTHLLEAARLGMGVALTRLSIADKLLRERQLVQAWPHRGEHTSAYYALSPRQAAPHPARDVFLDWLGQECARYRPPSGAIHRL